jgi:DNA-binding protein HU-beta
MKKGDFIKVVSEKASISRKDAEAVVNASLETISEILVNKDTITFMGFGTFDTVVRGERETTLPGTKKRITVPPRRSVKFKVGKNLKDSVSTIIDKEELKEVTKTVATKTAAKTTAATKTAAKTTAATKTAAKTTTAKTTRTTRKK